MFINQFGIWASQVADSTGETYNLTQEGSDLILLEGNSDELLTEAYPDIYRVLQEGAFPIFQEDGARLLQEDYVPPPLLLDTYSTDVYAAYSVRELNRSYSGDCLRIREDGGDTEIDIGFSDGWIDTAAIASHCGANNGYVTTWYDQSGNEKNITQSTAANQPLIFNGSAVSTDDNGNVQLEFDGANDSLLYSEANAGANDTSEIWVGEIATNNRFDYCWGGGDFGAGQGYAVMLNNNGVDRIVLRYDLSTGNKPEVDTNGSNITNNDPFLIVVRRNYSGRTANLKLNNDDELYSAVSSTGTVIHEGLLLMGKFNSGTNYTEGKVSEFIRFNEEISDAIATSIANDINGEYTLYV